MKDPILIKSNRYGIRIRFDPEISYQELLPEVKTKFEAAAHFFNRADMAVAYEGRRFTEEEERKLTETIEEASGIHILCIIEEDTYTERLHKRMVDESLEAIYNRDGQFYKGTLGERQILESETSIVIIGDVQERATVAARGNVVVIGSIYGTVIAGAMGNDQAVIAALHMRPKKLKIGDVEVKPVIGGMYSWAKLS